MRSAPTSRHGAHRDTACCARRRRARLSSVAVALALGCVAAHGHASSPDERFRQAGVLARAGDYPGAIAVYRELAARDGESASLYWNWAQAARARGAAGEALWALMRARDLDPADRAAARAIDELRAAANLDPAEIAPEPLHVAGRFARRLRLDLVAAALLLGSLLAHAVARARPLARWPARVAWGALATGLALSLVPLAGALARPTAVVVTRGAPLLDAASPSATTLTTLREGEVVPILERGGEYVRIEDSAGSRGWAHTLDVRPLERPALDPTGR